MATLDLPHDLAERARAHVTGEYLTVAEVVRAALDALDREQRQAAKLTALRAALAEGDASDDAPPGVFERARARHGLPAPQ